MWKPISSAPFECDVELSVCEAVLATATAEHTFAAGRAIEFTRMRITEAGRRALAEP
jgi:hypothetical protein